MIHEMHHTSPEFITTELLDELHRITPYDPDHLPAEIELIEVFHQRHPKLPQVACFDTAFHSTMPRVAGTKAAQDRVILAHLGSGSSMAAVYKGKSIDTSMGFTPAGGLMMGTRPGDLDPGVAWYMMKSEELSPKQFNTLINHESGLLGNSETSSDMHDLLGSQTGDSRAAEAVELFCYQAKKWIGAFAAVLGGLDVLVFSGGIGENAPEIRSRICDGLEYLGIEIDKKRNKTNGLVVSTDKGTTVVHVIHTDEEGMIAKTVSQMINHT